MTHLLLTILLWMGQANQVEFKLENRSNEVVHLRIENFRDVIIAPAGETDLAMAVGDRLFVLSQDDSALADEVFLFAVKEEHSGKTIAVDKLIKKALKAK